MITLECNYSKKLGLPQYSGCPDGSEICQDCFDAGQH